MNDELAKRIAKLSPERLTLLAERLTQGNTQAEAATGQPIAVIGMSCRFPGGANSPDLFWKLLKQGFDAVRETPRERWDAERYFDSDPAAPGKANSRWGAYLDQVDQFDAAFFGISPGEAAAMDPQQRMLLELAVDAFDDSGQTIERLAGTKTGVFVGIINHSSQYYWMQAADLRELNPYSCTGTAHSLMANRLSYQFDLKGPSVAVDTACSSSLYAVHLAIQSLRQHESDLALAGGAHLLLTPESTVMLSKLNMMSPDGHCKTFDARANGFVRGEGCGLVVLKRLADAVADEDNVLAIVRGTAVNQDGRSNGVTAPNGLSQQALIREALKNGRVHASQVTYVETHGTGTALGDPIEIDALAHVFAQSSTPTETCVLGSVKANIGHLEGAAGIAGFIKAVLCLKNGRIPPQIHFQELNPHIDLGNTRFLISKEGIPWEIGPGKRFAAVSSFGVGGTNAHVILQGADIQHQPARDETVLANEEQGCDRIPHAYLLPISARSGEALVSLARSYRDFLTATEAEHSPRLADVCFSASVRRSHHEHRLAVSGNSAEELCSNLEAFVEQKPGRGHFAGRVSPGHRQSLVFVFSGQGPQWAGMGTELLRSEPVFAEVFEHCDALLRKSAEWSLLEEIAKPDASSRLSETQVAQPAIFALQIGIAALFRSWGVAPDAVVGHSVGEIAAAYVSGALAFEDAVRVAFERGRLMQRATGHGKMASIEVPSREVEELLAGFRGRLSVAAINSPSTTVVSGECAALEEFLQRVEAQGRRIRRLPVDYAFHSAQMDSIQDELIASLWEISPQNPSIPLFSTVSGRSDVRMDAEYWWRNVRQPVLFSDAITQVTESGHELFVEIGPHPVLTAPISQCAQAAGKEVTILSSLRRREPEKLSLQESLSGLYASGHSLYWKKINGNRGKFIQLPSYTWQRRRYWLERSAQSEIAEHSARSSSSGLNLPQPLMSPGAGAETSRRARMLEILVPILQQLSGLELNAIKPDATFMGLGLDSLFLTQASQAFSKRFRVKISIRQMMEELNSLEAIAAFLEKVVPDMFPEIATHALKIPQSKANDAAAQTSSPRTEVATGDAAVHGSVVEQLVREQLRLMARQLDVLEGAGLGSSSTAMLFNAQTAAGHSTIDFDSPVEVAPADETKTTRAATHGPFRPIAKDVGADLTATQRRALDGLVERYTRRTQESKRLTQMHRARLADPRTVSGFKQLWKEMVYPIVSERSAGSKIWDVDGNEYVDFIMGFGANLFGHMPSFVESAIHEQLKRGMEIGPQTVWAGKVAELICEFTGMDRVAFCNTGSEAVQAALRVARTVTAREKVVMFEGDYHGMFDEVLVRPGPFNGKLRSWPIAPGIPQSSTEQMLVLDYCSPKSLNILEKLAPELAAVLVEPVQARRPEREPAQFLQQLRKLTEKFGAALIFDELVTGFRIHPGGAQAVFNIKADLATYGKVVAGGLPIGVLAGKSGWMDALDGGFWNYGDDSFPEAGVTFFAGTFVRHPLAMASAHAVLQHLKVSGHELQQRLNDKTTELVSRLNAISKELGVPLRIHHFGSIFYLHIPAELPFAGLLFYLLREKGIHTWENRFFVLTTAHSDKDIERLVNVFRESLLELQAGEFLSGQLPEVRPEELPALHSTSGANQGLTEPASSIVVPRNSAVESPEETFPLTESQTEILLASQMSADAAVAYNESLSLRFRGAFDADLFRAAIAQVVQRHPIVRASISSADQSQHVKRGIAIEVPLIDLSARNPIDQETELAALVKEETLQPFDLAAGPLFRVRIVRLSTDRHVALWTAHHIVCDGWSSGVLISELAKIYSAAKQGARPVLDVPSSFRRYAEQNGPATTEVRRSVAYWRQQFADMPTPLDLPTDHPRPPVRSAKASTIRKVFDAPFFQSLKRVAGQQRTTLVVLLMCTLKTLLYRLTGQEDLVVGLSAAGQVIKGEACLVGHCVNLLPIRTKLRSNVSFEENLAAVKKNVLDAYEHYECTLGGLLHELAIPRNPSRSPLVEVIFNVDRDPSDVNFDGLEFDYRRNPKQALHFDLFFNFVEGASGLTLECEYNTDLFDGTTIDRWLVHYETLLVSIAENQTETIEKIRILTERERDQLTIEWNGTGIEFPKEKNLHEWFEDVAARAPDNIAVTFGEQELSYFELNRRANQLAHYLRELGVGPDVLVGLFVERSIEMVIGIVAILKAGGAYLPIDPVYPKDRIAFMLEDANVTVLLTQFSLAAKLPQHNGIAVFLDAFSEVISRQSAVNPHRNATPDNLAYVIYTSGSTGQPKGVRVTHYNVVRLMQATEPWYRFNDQDVWTLFHSHAFDFSVWELWGALFYGGRLVIVPYLTSRSPEDFYKLLVGERVTVLNQTPSAFRQLIQAEENLGLSGVLSLRYIIFGGEALDVHSLKPWFDRHGDRRPLLINMYGITETTVHVTYRPLSCADVHSGSVIGVPIPDLQIYILDRYQQPVPIGVTGEVYVGGAGVAHGYLRREELTDEKFLPDVFTNKPDGRIYRSGDLARYKANRDIEYLGRADDQVKIRGFRIELGEIEATILRHSNVRQCVAIAREDEPGLKQLVAYVVPKSEGELKTEDLRQQLKTTLPEFMVPSAIVVLEAFPLTPNGKIDRKALPAPGPGKIQVARDFAAPRDPLEQSLAHLFAKVLKVPRVGIHDSFFDLGGHSLLALRVVVESERLYKRRLPLATLMQYPTVAGLAEVFRQEEWKPSWSCLVPIKPGGSRPPLFLMHSHGGNVLEYYPLANLLDADQPVYGIQAQGLDGQIVRNQSLESITASYVAEIRTLQPEGPYLLGGFCFGGLLAFEAARQLTAAGEEVASVMLIQTMHTASGCFEPNASFFRHAWYRATKRFDLERENLAYRGKSYIEERLRYALSRARARTAIALDRFSHKGHAQQTNWPMSYVLESLRIEHGRMADAYQAGAYSGNVVLFRASKQLKGLITDGTLGWASVVTGNLSVCEIPGHQQNILLEPNVSHLAKELTVRLASIQNELESRAFSGSTTADVSVVVESAPQKAFKAAV